jgi:pyruvate dehydrogenase E2 component (dihydrolipoamide acetyltransferase)
MNSLNHRRKLAIATYVAPREGNIYGKLTIDATQAIAYAEHHRRLSGEKVTLTHVVGKAIAEGLKAAPMLNAWLIGSVFIQNPDVTISYIVGIPGDDDLGKAKIEHADRKTVVEIAREVRERADLLRQGKDPDFESAKKMLKVLPAWLIGPVAWATGLLTAGLGISVRPLGLEARPFGACVISSMGMFGIDEGFIPPTPWARAPVWVLIGAVRQQPAVLDGQIVARPMLSISATIDHRFMDGMKLAALTRMVRGVLENPWILDGLEGPPAQTA